MEVLNVILPPFPIAKSVYVFKMFKKTTKFKRFRKYKTGFIMNRKKYILRRKVSRFQVLFNSAYAWTFLYRRYRHTTRFLQNVNWMSASLTFSYGAYVATACTSTYYRPLTCVIPNFTAASKKIFFNHTFFRQPNEYFLRVLSGATHVGFINADCRDLDFLDVTQSGIFIHDLTFLTPSFYPEESDYYNAIKEFSAFPLTHALSWVKVVYQIIIWLVLYHTHQNTTTY